MKAITTLTWASIKAIGCYDKANRWYPTDERVKPYFDHLRSPSRTFPHSYSKSAQTKKFAQWLCENHLDLAKELGLI